MPSIEGKIEQFRSKQAQNWFDYFCLKTYLALRLMRFTPYLY